MTTTPTGTVPERLQTVGGGRERGWRKREMFNGAASRFDRLDL